ncbi:D-2-hydroxyacid dehydrogenase [Chloroflexota bacterium]
MQQIAAINSRIKLEDVSALLSKEIKGDFSSKEYLDAVLADAEVIFGLRLPENIITRSHKLRWIQSMSAGVEAILDKSLVDSSVVVTTMRGIHAIPIGECVLGLMLMFVKHSPSYFELKRKKQWKPIIPAVLHSKTVGIVGMGSIGQEVARLAKAFGMKVIATRRSTKKTTRATDVDVMLPRTGLYQLLSESDFVVLTLPLTAETNKLIAEKELRAMKSTAYLINVARGNVVDEEMLIRALEDGWVAGAGLDVFATEPLPAESTLWELPNVIFTPHITGNMADYNMQATRLFCENLSRYLDGRKLLNAVDKKKGY